jgi:rubrerythrin
MEKFSIKEQELRRKIFEFLLNSEEVKDIVSVPKKSETQKKLYDNIIELKNMIEGEEEDEKKILDKIKETMHNLTSFQKILEKFV